MPSVREETRYGLRGYVDADRRWYFAVSTLLDILAPMPAGWIDSEALELGAVLHRAMFLLSKDELAPTASAFPRADAAIDWLMENDLRVVEAETPRTTIRGWAGRPDALLQRKRGRGLIVADFKFAEGLIPRYEVQLEMYRRLYAPLPQMLLLQIPKTGKPNPKWLRPDPGHYAAGLNALSILNWRLRYGNRTR